MAKRVYMTYEDRCILERLLKSGVSITQTAELMERSRSTIYNEFARTGMDSGNYDALKAQKILWDAQTGNLPLQSVDKASSVHPTYNSGASQDDHQKLVIAG